MGGGETRAGTSVGTEFRHQIFNANYDRASASNDVSVSIGSGNSDPQSATASKAAQPPHSNAPVSVPLLSKLQKLIPARDNWLGHIPKPYRLRVF